MHTNPAGFVLRGLSGLPLQDFCLSGQPLQDFCLSRQLLMGLLLLRTTPAGLFGANPMGRVPLRTTLIGIEIAEE